MILVRFSMPYEIQSGNKLAYAHWRKRTIDRMRWEQRLRLLGPSCVAHVAGIRRITITSMRKRMLDTDNLSAGAKHLRDAIVRAGYVRDDSPKHSEWVYVQEKSKTPETIIAIEQLP